MIIYNYVITYVCIEFIHICVMYLIYRQPALEYNDIMGMFHSLAFRGRDDPGNHPLESPGQGWGLSRHGIFSPVKIWCWYRGNTMGIYIYIYDIETFHIFSSDVTAMSLQMIVCIFVYQPQTAELFR